MSTTAISTSCKNEKSQITNFHRNIDFVNIRQKKTIPVTAAIVF